MKRVTLNEYRITFTLIVTVIILLANWLTSDIFISTMMNILMFMYMSFYYGTASFKAGRMERIRKEVSFFSDVKYGEEINYTVPLTELSEKLESIIETDDDYAESMLLLIDSWRKLNPDRNIEELLKETENKIQKNSDTLL